MKTITPQQHAEMMEFLDDLVEAVTVRSRMSEDDYIRVYSDEFDRVINLRDAYLSLKAREDERTAHMSRIGRKTSEKKANAARTNLAKANQSLVEKPELRARGSRLVKKTPIVSEP